MSDKSRDLQAELLRRITVEAPLIQVLIGPRQVGKTTVVRAVLERLGGVYETADSPTPLPPQVITEWWSQAVGTPSQLLIIDEIQKIQGWAEVLKKLWDTRTSPMRVVVTGSSSLQIEKGLRESLAGRYELLRVEHWNLLEAHRVFGLSADEFIEFGCYPGAERFRDDRERWASYVRDAIVEPVLGRDLLQLHPVENPALLRQIFGVALQQPAEIISLQKIQGQLQDRGAIATIQHYLWLLSQAFLVTGIQKYSPVALRVRQSSPKLIVHDNALVRAHERPVGAALSRERLGRYLENAVGARLIEAGWECHYWKERDLEVDFVVDGPRGEKWAIEVKAKTPRANEIKGLIQFCRRFPEYRPVVVCLEPIASDLSSQISVLPAAEILGLSRGS